MQPLHPYALHQAWRHPPAPAGSALPDIDLQAFSADLRALRTELGDTLDVADLRHLLKMQRWGRGCSVLGWMLCGFCIPLAAVLLSLGNVARWTMVSHHVMHRGYDRVPGVPKALTSAHYAIGRRRWLDWLDWMHPRAWAHEHNQLHHLHTGELDDPDLVEHNAWLIRAGRCPRPLKWLLVLILMCTWKFSYYAPNTWWAYRQLQRQRAQDKQSPQAAKLPHMGNAWRLLYPGERVILPLSRDVPSFWMYCVAPYAVVRFGLLPAPFLLLGIGAWLSALMTLLAAELLANIHAFVIIAPNHVGDDIYRFDTHFKDRQEFDLRQVIGSVNYPGGTDLRDFLMGYLNYQIEHHLWPDLPMLKYRQAAPRLKAICARHGVPYVEQSVFRRFGKLWAILMGDSHMRRIVARPLVPVTRPGHTPSVNAEPTAECVAELGG
jgi:fatty acid desaturase